MRVLYNARIYTLDPSQPLVNALAVENGRILAAGSNDLILNGATAGCEKEDLDGKTILPGFTDAHMHLGFYASSLYNIDCETSTRQECLRRVAEKARLIPQGEWILGQGWNHNVWEDGFGSARELDQVAPANPVSLITKSGHASWVNTLALQIAGIGTDTPDPQGGRIGRDDQGNPNGILFESTMSLIDRVVPALSATTLSRYIQQAQYNLCQMGITSVHDFDRSDCFTALQMLHEQNQLVLRVTKSIALEDFDAVVSVGLRSGFGDDFLRIGSVKMFADGALGPQTAAMLSHYKNNPEQKGMLLLDSRQMLEYGKKASTAGLSLAVHAIGDRANQEVLNAYAQMREFESENNLPHLRHRIEHVQLLHPDDLSRLAQYNIIASMQPIHATSDMVMADRHWGKRSTHAYAWQSLLRVGTLLVFGSDAPVESPNPFLGLHAAVTRCRIDGFPSPEGWYPAQRLSLQEALEGFITAPPYATKMEQCLGRLSPNFYADLILLDEDPFSLLHHDLHKIRPCATMINGDWIWRS